MSAGPRLKKKGFFLRAGTAFSMTETLAVCPAIGRTTHEPLVGRVMVGVLPGRVNHAPRREVVVQRRAHQAGVVGETIPVVVSALRSRDPEVM